MISLVEATSGTDTTIVLSSSLQANDFAIFYNRSTDSVDTPAVNDPSGWFRIATGAHGGPDTRDAIYCKVLDGTESNIAGMTGDTTNEWYAQVWRGDLPIINFVNQSVNSIATAGDPDPQVITASLGVRPLLVFATMHSSGVVDPRTVSPSLTEVELSTNTYIHYNMYTTAVPVNHTVDMDDEGFNFMHSFYIEFAFQTQLPPFILDE